MEICFQQESSLTTTVAFIAFDTHQILSNKLSFYLKKNCRLYWKPFYLLTATYCSNELCKKNKYCALYLSFNQYRDYNYLQIAYNFALTQTYLLFLFFIISHNKAKTFHTIIMKCKRSKSTFIILIILCVINRQHALDAASANGFVSLFAELLNGSLNNS